MKVFVWDGDFLKDYSGGLGVVIAENEEQAKELLRKAMPQEAANCWQLEEGLKAKPKVYSIIPKAFYLVGGAKGDGNKTTG